MAFRPTHVADTSAAIAYLKGEPGATVFADLLLNEAHALAIHAVNACELYYNYLGADGFDVAEEAWQRLQTIVTIVSDLSEQFLKRVAHWKTTHYGGQVLGLGDSFAAATAAEFGCPLVTTDHGDFDPVEAAGALNILWLR
jgi:predicted nucleic acid-binding protein